MSIDPYHDTLIPLSEIAKQLPQRPSPASLWRWHSKGINGIRLEVIRVGGRLYTTARAWRTFVEHTTRPDVAAPPVESDERSAATDHKLREKGLL